MNMYRHSVMLAAVLVLLGGTGALGGEVVNFERVGYGVDGGGKFDPQSFSKLAPWPDVDGKMLYSGCYDPTPLIPAPLGHDRCFITVSLAQPDHPQRLSTTFGFDPIASPPPPPGHVVWQKDYRFPNLPAKAPCHVDWADAAIAAGTSAPACWDPGWNTHTHYVARGPGKLLAVNQEFYRAGTNRQSNYHGVKFYDVSDPAHPRFLSYWEAPASPPDSATGVSPDAYGVHHFNFSGNYLFLGSEYQGYVGKILVILDLSDPTHPREVSHWGIAGQKTPEEDAIRNWDQRFQFWLPVVKQANGRWTKHVGMHYVTVYGDIAYLSYHQAGLVILDVSDKARPKLLSHTDYLVPGAEPDTPDRAACEAAAGGQRAACGNAHSAKLVPGRPDLLVMTDEYFSCPWGHMRIFDVADPTKPRVLSHMTIPATLDCDPRAPQQAADAARYPRRGPSTHIGNAWNRSLYFVAWYGAGLYAIDIADPVHPKEVGHYHYRLGDDYGNTEPRFAGADTYDVIFGDDDRLYVSDGTAGMRVLRYTGPAGRRVRDATASADRIIISGASGQLGELVVQELLARGVAPSNLILVSRTPAKLAEFRKLGADVRFGDVDQPESLPAAYAGGTRMLMISLGGRPDTAPRPPRHKLAFDAAVKAGVQHIVYTSFIGADKGGSFLADDHQKSENFLKASGARWTILRNGVYADYQVPRAVQMVATGKAAVTADEPKSALVARVDCAAAAAGALLGSQFENQAFDITGPELVNGRDVARLASEITGRAIEVVVQAEPAGGPPGGMPPVPPTVSDAVARLAGRPAMSLRAVLEANRAPLRAAVPRQ
jgi:NAD(P)H dehydrogenase (quinone)